MCFYALYISTSLNIIYDNILIHVSLYHFDRILIIVGNANVISFFCYDDSTDLCFLYIEVLKALFL